MRIFKIANEMRIKMVLSLGILAAVHATAATPLSLPETLKVAEDNSPQIRKAEAAKDEAQWKNLEAFSVFLPKINVTGQHLLDNKFMVEQVAFPGAPTPESILLVQPYTIWSLRGDWVFFDGFANYDYYKSNTLAASAAEKEADWSRFQVRQDTKLQFFKALAASELEKVADQNVKTLQEHLDRAKAFRQSGAGTNFDVLRVEVQLNEAQSEKLNSADNTILSRQNLLNNIGVDDQGQGLTGDLPVPSAAKVSSLQKPVVMDRLDY
ncbi:MAG TPA: TolC family protein, partial [Bdellovibrio sp.]|nr:TolC family protein [Bdellovibrio sp.]